MANKTEQWSSEEFNQKLNSNKLIPKKRGSLHFNYKDDSPQPKVKKKTVKQVKDDKIDLFVIACKQHLGVIVETEYYFDSIRRWRFDYAIPEAKIALEKDGGSYSKRTYKNKQGELITTIGGRHNSGTGFLNDQEKMNKALELGWRVTHCIPKDLMTKGYQQIEQLLNNNKTK